jgi:ectoine hydroxylase-related dioxygenase (phytanoyl-CoA dioxygenase family)
MSAGLAPALAARFARDGFLAPLPVMPPEEAAALLERLEAFEARAGAEAAGYLRHKGHLVAPFLDEIIRDARILDRVEALIGPDILCWTINAFIKEPGDGAYVSWHQDATYWGLSGNEVVTAWLALTPATPESGCMRMLPGSHTWPVQPHRDTHAPGNLLSRGQEIAVEVDEAQAVDIVLAPGEMSLHHVLIAHASGPNRSPARRIGIAVRYIPTRLAQTAAPEDSAALVRGCDRYGHFTAEPRPAGELDEAGRAAHREVVEAARRLLYRNVEIREQSN